MITKQLLREWSACWPDDRIDQKLSGRPGLTPREIATDTTIPLDDRLWVGCKMLWHLDPRAARCFAVERALTVAHLAGDEDDQAQFHALMAHIIEIEDLPEHERAAARAAARDAARAAAWAAARAAAWDAARDAARATAWDAARDAARAAARATAWDAALQEAITSAINWLGDHADE